MARLVDRIECLLKKTFKPRGARLDWIAWKREPMRDFRSFRRTAIRYWERRRIIYNLALVPPAFFSYGFTDNLNWVGDPHITHYSYILPLFALSAVGANICYTFSYALEFIFGSDNPASRWMTTGRTMVFIAGVLFAMVLAFIGGWNIAELEWYHGFKHAG